MLRGFGAIDQQAETFVDNPSLRFGQRFADTLDRAALANPGAAGMRDQNLVLNGADLFECCVLRCARGIRARLLRATLGLIGLATFAIDAFLLSAGLGFDALAFGALGLFALALRGQLGALAIQRLTFGREP
ncbi:MAG: hypothetical protein VB131_08500, partial [Burkholderia gladioli]